ncbi:hypothetical protein BV22DRAFT_1132920 [Leucogyrophana mollusca]|uniref:Uncharacterized protein n=1 Tax=Leucogyrophana mollusca TaxID=85980 RepID=A0ACB8B6Y7_9AGAM|nr:hypothetical protein BV22DRAFT_1132920 [Leucogyrophana mollusca]
MATTESAVRSIHYNNCFSVAVTTLLVYDYLLTIGQEDEYVWQRSMSPMSFLYYVVRYLGLFVGIVVALWGSFIRGCVSSISMLWSTRSDTPGVDIGTGFYMFGNLGFYVIIWASAGELHYSSPAIMVLRIFAMYNQSKIILGVLLVFFVPTVVSMIVIIAKLFNGKSVVTAFDLLGTNYCAQVSSSSRAQTLLFVHLTIPRICFDVLLVVLAVGRLVKNVVDNRVLGGWQPNVYLRMLARDSTVYFLLNLAFTLIEIIGLLSTIPVSSPITPMGSRVSKSNDIQASCLWLASCFNVTVPFMLAPHLIISFRHHTKADAIHSGFASHLGTSLGAGEQEMCFARPGTASSMDERGV